MRNRTIISNMRKSNRKKQQRVLNRKRQKNRRSRQHSRHRVNRKRHDIFLNRTKDKSRNFRQDLRDRALTNLYQLILINCWPDGDPRCYSLAYEAAVHMVDYGQSLPAEKLLQIWTECDLECCYPIADVQERSLWQIQVHEYEHARMSLGDEESDTNHREDVSEKQRRRKENETASLGQAYYRDSRIPYGLRPKTQARCSGSCNCRKCSENIV